MCSASRPVRFSTGVYRYHLLPYPAVNIAALWIAWMEITCAFILLFIPPLRRAALLLILSMLIIFSLGIGVNLIQGRHIACGCFTSSPMAHPVGWPALLKNLGLTLVAAYVIATQRRN